jgi:hypothetical protein
MAQPARRFTKPHGQVDNRLQALRVGSRKAVAVRQHKFGVAQDSGEQVIDFMAQDFGATRGQACPRRPERGLRTLGPAQSALDQTGGHWNKITGARNILQVIFGDQARDIGAFFDPTEQYYRSCFGELANRLDQWGAP